jgi:preprotein translocase subunit YajC
VINGAYAKIFWFILIVVTCNYVFQLNNYHDWGDDFALYLNQAKCILQGNSAALKKANTALMEYNSHGPNLYPVGYPIILSSIYTFVANNFIFYKVLNLLFLFISLWVIYKICVLLVTEKWVPYATIITVLLNKNYSLVANEVISDTASLVIGLLAIYFSLYILLNDSKRIYALITGLLIIAAINIRSSNKIIFFALILVVIYFFITNKNNLKGKTINYSIALGIPALFWIISVFNNWQNDGNLNQFFNIKTNGLALQYNLPYYAVLIGSPFEEFIMYLFKALMGNYTPFNMDDFVKLFFSLVLMFSFFYFIIKIPNNILAKLFISIICVGTLCLLLIWPFQQGQRFIFLILPFLYLSYYSSVARLFNTTKAKYISGVSIFLLAASFIISNSYNLNTKQVNISNEKWGRPGSKAFSKMMSYISNTADSSTIVCSKPRLVRYFTNNNAQLLDVYTLDRYQKILFIKELDKDYIEKIKKYNLNILQEVDGLVFCTK